MTRHGHGGHEATRPAADARPPTRHVRTWGGAGDDVYDQLATAVLVAHQRRDAGSCLCGWSELGASHAQHVAGVLRAAGALRQAGC